MGVVYRAEHVGLKRVVALKVLDAEFSTPTLVARFQREATSAARLDHPGCVRILDHGHTATYQYLTMELVEGPTLAHVMRREGRLSTRDAVAIARDLLAALAHAHAHDLLHRDVKPENIILGRREQRPRLVLIDFGLARLRDDATLTVAGTCVGSPSYLAPERLLGRLCDKRADLYSVGVILYEMLAGVRPFAGGCVEEIVRAHIVKPPPPLRAVRCDVPVELDRIIARALAKDPDHRFADADAMLSALVEMPLAERIAPRASTTLEPRGDEPTIAVIELAPVGPSIANRVWTWLRTGARRAQAPAGR
jgi:serine/threonine-protein kinase